MRCAIEERIASAGKLRNLYLNGTKIELGWDVDVLPGDQISVRPAPEGSLVDEVFDILQGIQKYDIFINGKLKARVKSA